MADFVESAEVTRIPSRRNSRSPPQLNSSTNFSFGASSAEVTPTTFQFIAEPPPQWNPSTDLVQRGRALSGSQHSNPSFVYEERREKSKESSQSNSPRRYNGSREKSRLAIDETKCGKSKSQKTDQGTGKLCPFWKHVLKSCFACWRSGQKE